MIDRVKDMYGYQDKLDAFKRSFNILRIVYDFFVGNYKIFLPVIYTLTAFWQAYMISDVIDSMSVFYYIDAQYSIILFVKLFTLILLVFLMVLVLIAFVTFSPFFISSLFFITSIGLLIKDYFGIDISGSFWFIAIPWIALNIGYYFISYKKEILVGIIILSFPIGLLSGFSATDILKKEKDNIKITLNDGKEINGVLNFYNGKYYFIENGESKELINDKFIFKVIFK